MATGIQPDGSGSASRRSRNAMRVKPYAIRFPSRNAHHTALPAPGGWISTSGCSCRYRSSLRIWSGRPGGTSCTGQYRHPASGQRNGFPKSPAPCHHRYGYECRRALVRPSKRRLNAGLDLPVPDIPVASGGQPHFWACSSHRAQSKTRSFLGNGTVKTAAALVDLHARLRGGLGRRLGGAHAATSRMPIAASPRPARCTQRSRSPSTALASSTVTPG
jgi:hypothetical protein